MSVKYSVLDLVSVAEGRTIRETYLQSIELAKHVEKLGYYRYWVAEHHNFEGLASAATAVVLSFIAEATKTIRIGSGGIMLPNHAPLIIAEQFGTLEAMYPGRIDLGLGRTPGSGQKTAQALRGDFLQNGSKYPPLLEELRNYLNPSEYNPVRAIPGEGQNIPIWLLGSTDFSAKLAGELGLPFGFASHFSKTSVLEGIRTYQEAFQPSSVLNKPHSMLALNVFAADCHDKAQMLSTSFFQQFLQ